MDLATIFPCEEQE